MGQSQEKLISKLLIILTIISILCLIIIYLLTPRPPESLLYKLLIDLIPGTIPMLVAVVVLYFLFGHPYIKTLIPSKIDSKISNFECTLYPKKTLSLNDSKKSIDILFEIIRRSNWRPNIIFGVNQGGVVLAAAAASKFLIYEIGTIFTQKSGSQNRYVCGISSPDESNKDKKIRILVLDSKLKSGKSSIEITKAIQQKYGNDIDLVFGIALLYTGNTNRKEFIEKAPPWPIMLKEDSLQIDKLFCAYYTECPVDKDHIWEELRW